MLAPEELTRRLVAARTLRGMDQADLAKLVESDGLGKHDVGRLERGKLPLSRALRVSLVHHLKVPSAWFTDPELDLSNDKADHQGDVDQIAALIAEHDEGMHQRVEEILAARDITLDRVLSRLNELSAVGQTLQANLSEALERLDRQAAETDLLRDLPRPELGDAGTGTNGS